MANLFKAAEIRKAESDITKRIVKIVFSTRRSKAKKNGKKVIEDDTYALRRSILQNKGFLKFDDNSETIQLDLSFVEYYLYLDEGTDHIEPWFLSGKILDDPEIQKILAKLMEKGYKRKIINLFNDYK
jgi:hypothetical protein